MDGENASRNEIVESAIIFFLLVCGQLHVPQNPGGKLEGSSGTRVNVGLTGESSVRFRFFDLSDSSTFASSPLSSLPSLVVSMSGMTCFFTLMDDVELPGIIFNKKSCFGLGDT